MSFAGVTIQEEAELIMDIPFVTPGSIAHYAFPAYNNYFPSAAPLPDLPRMHLAGCHSDDVNNPQLLWSSGIDLSMEHDIFVNIPEMSDTKVHVEKVGHIVHVFIDAVSRAEILAKEVRSRIKGKEVTTVVTEMSPPKASLLRDNASRHASKESPPREAVSKQRSVQASPRTLFECSIVCSQACLIVLDEFSSMSVVHEMFRVTGEGLYLMAYPHIEQTLDNMKNYQPHLTHSVLMAATDIQIDNQMFRRGMFDFPVVLIRQNTDTKPDSTGRQFLSMTETDKVNKLRKRSTMLLDVGLCTDLIKNQLTLHGFSVISQPLTLYVEDIFVYDCLHRIHKFIPSNLSKSKPDAATSHSLPQEVMFNHIGMSQPVRLEYVTIEPIALLVSVHASLKLFIASDNTPLRFGKFERKALFTSTQQFVRGVAMHYASAALFRAG